MLVQSQKISALMIKREAFGRQQTALLGTHGFDMLTLITNGEKETGEEMREIRIGEISKEGGKESNVLDDERELGMNG